MSEYDGGCGGRRVAKKMLVYYQNVGGGVSAMHEFLERCNSEGVGVMFMGEPCVKDGGRGTQTHPGYILMGKVVKGMRVPAYVRLVLVDRALVVHLSLMFVCVVIGDVRFGGVYSKCRSTSQAMSD